MKKTKIIFFFLLSWMSLCQAQVRNDVNITQDEDPNAEQFIQSTFLPSTQAQPTTSTSAALPSGKGEANVPEFDTIKNLAQNGQRDKAIQLALTRLKTHPDDWDTRIILGYAYLWNDNYADAKTQFELVLKNKPNYTDAREGLINVAIKTDDYPYAFQLIDEGLRLSKDENKYNYLKAKTYMAMHDYEKAFDLIKVVLKNDPDNQDAKDMLDTIAVLAPDVVWKNRVFAYNEYDLVSDLNQEWNYAMIGYTHDFPRGSIFAKLNYAQRFGGITSFQEEVDAYPDITSNIYAYLNYGYSTQPLFPQERYGWEPFVSLLAGLEVSGGQRYLKFDSVTRIYTGSLSKYVGDYWFSFRPYVTPSSTGTSKSYYFTARRYFDNSYDFISLTGGFGSGGDDSSIDPEDLSALRKQRIYLEGSTPATKHVYIGWTLGYEKEVFAGSRARETIDGGAQLSYFF